MFVRVMISFVAFALATLSVTARDDKKGDKDKLQGEWSVVSMERAEGKLDDEALKKSKLVIKGDMWLATTNGRESGVSTQLDESKTPKEIDFTGPDPSGKEATVKAIYKLDGDTLTVCRRTFSAGGDRPKEFEAGDGLVLTVYKRTEKK
jgi:uncharacterized protein (TIGR03067 family)